MEDLVESFSGVRGIYGKSITESFAKKYASAFANWLKKKAKALPKIVIGIDTRKSGPKLKTAMIEACSAFAKEIIDVEIATTPMIELAVREYKADGGIIITASHNEPEFNGWKFLDSTGAILPASDMTKIIGYAKKEMIIIKASSKCKITNKALDIEDKYRKFVLKIIGNKTAEKIRRAKLCVVADINGSSAWSIAGKVLNDLKVKTLVIAGQPGEFKRIIEPNEATLAYLNPIVKEENASFGVGFDCDADRAEIVVPFGELYGKTLSGHYLLAIIADYMLPKAKPAKRIVVVNDATSQIVKTVVEKHKGKLFEVEVGETNVISEMQKRKACLGGEGSNSGIVPPSTSRDGILDMAMLLGIIAEKKKSLVEIVMEMPRYYTARVKIKTNAKNIKQTVRKFFSGNKITETGDETGGIKVWLDESSWLWFRASRTEPGITRIFADSTSDEKSNDMILLGKKVLGIEEKVC